MDYLKIDGSFVRGIATDRIDRAAVASIQQLAHAAGAKTIAECVESQAILERVRSMGIALSTSADAADRTRDVKK